MQRLPEEGGACYIRDHHAPMRAIVCFLVVMSGVNTFAQELGVAIGSQKGETTRLTAFAHGGTAPYTYAWSNGTSDRNLTIDRPGRYMVVVTDATGLTVRASMRVRRNAEVDLEQRELVRVQRRAAAYGDLRVNQRDDYFIDGVYTGHPVRINGPSHRHHHVTP
jgi:hypothetical protein